MTLVEFVSVVGHIVVQIRMRKVVLMREACGRRQVVDGFTKLGFVRTTMCAFSPWFALATFAPTATATAATPMAARFFIFGRS